MKRRLFAVAFIITLLCTFVGLYIGLTNRRLVTKKVTQVEIDGKKYEQTEEVYSDNTAAAGMVLSQSEDSEESNESD